ncbi:NADPH-dependent F420 reductase [Paenibacillus sp. HJGM_3]|uniref:NADPH-dependent F420 reductase n=1 Tax=Paenibacillus sp. HJGM_3 TaxID=3379816 RepID=UPI00385C50F4
MRIGIIGSGNAAQTLGSALVRRGHEVKLGTRSPGKLTHWLEQQNSDDASVGSFRDAAAFGQLVINATAGDGSLEALRAAGSEHLNGKIVLDISLPLDFSTGILTLSVANTDSLGEQIQREFPRAKVVKTLNTVTSAIMVNPLGLADGEHHLFLSGNDAAAKREVQGYLADWFGWKLILDIGDISSARGTEMLLALSSRIYGALGHMNFSFRVVQ